MPESRAEAHQADATRLPFPDDNFDVALSFLMLHHVGAWEAALGEMARVLRPGGLLLGYDLLNRAPVDCSIASRAKQSRPLIPLNLLRRLQELPVQDVTVRNALGFQLARFSAIKS